MTEDNIKQTKKELCMSKFTPEQIAELNTTLNSSEEVLSSEDPTVNFSTIVADSTRQDLALQE